MTIPKELRDQLGIRHGIVLEFSATGGKLVAVKPVAKAARELEIEVVQPGR